MQKNKQEQIAELYKSNMLVFQPDDGEVAKQFKLLSEDELCIIQEIDQQAELEADKKDGEPTEADADKPGYILDLTQSQFPALIDDFKGDQ